MKEFKYAIGQSVMQRNNEGEIEETFIVERTRINGNNAYITSLIGKWESESFIYESK